MGFLDDLKRQADTLKAQQNTDTAALERNMHLADAACHSAFSYFNALVAQLNVLQPTSAGRFDLDRQTRFDGLKLDTFRADARRKRLRGHEVYDHAVLRWNLRSGRAMEVTKDFPPEVARIERRLRHAGAEFDSEVVRDPDSGRLHGTRFTFSADFNGEILVTPLHDEGRVRIEADNIDGFERVSVEFAAFDLGSARLDELAKWLVGQPHAFLKDGLEIRRVEA